ncbi:MAG: bifunctional acetate--CoA ligase family protein/GNAT family N-acetyltransferase [Betaproteobacteria bacterium]|nr:bifunctional acetate--CoA ligase family protein/GNAT family N-acetyltransferase [Betaproteobacteria bacterium]MDH5221641.1 bifunctional acetate--CoA ligase family protein/GNAT family N-acetyltransferase [Betaproteobacteria bacterium]MDH5349723.1 bifunctional acetate--CoA ligase family protein/GNAT family N-acetyltransferase [Betaproteobacteria bacterium]
MAGLSGKHYLTPLFEPAAVAVIGATERAGAVGGVLIGNMLAAGYRGELFAVNPKYRAVQGVPCFTAIGKVPRRVDLVVIATPAATVPEVVEQCGRAGVRAAVVISAGFSEIGPAGAKLERALLEAARRHRLRLVGPNCLGLMRPALGLNATFARGATLAGSLGLVAQSGAVCTAMLDWARPNGVGFSSVVSLGGSTDIDFGEIVDYLIEDEATEHILLYIEGVRSARRFVSALRAAARVKPVIVMKAGRHPAGSRAAVSHTGAIVGMDDVFDAVVKRAGVVRVGSIGQMVAAAQALAAHVRPRGDRLAVVTNGGGPGVMAADRAGDLGIPLAQLAPATLAALKRALPASWSQGNPVDLIGDADAARYRAAVSACLADDGVDGVLAILTPQAMTEPNTSAQAVIEAARGSSKPVLACWMGEEQTAAARRELLKARIPVFRTPDPAVQMFGHLSAFYRNQRALLQTPGPAAAPRPPDIATARAIVDAALAEKREVLSEMESKALLAAFAIPIARTVVTRSPHEAMVVAGELGFPVAMKIDSPDITHKSEVGGVRLNVASAQAVETAWREVMGEARRLRPEARLGGIAVEPMVRRPYGRELMVGVLRDPVFGPAIAFGTGGTAVEIHRDRAVALPPLNRYLIDDMIHGTRVARLLGEFRRMPPVDRDALAEVLLRVSEMVCELPELAELDINPLIADADGAVAVDARAVLRPGPPRRDRYGHMAIHPYPTELVSTWQPSEGPRVTLRPIRPEDAEMEQAFVKRLSSESRYFRFMDTLRELTPLMLVRFTQIDYDREMAFVATVPEGSAETEVAVARYVANPDGESCEFALVVADDWQGRGLGRRLMEKLIAVARARGQRSMLGHVLAENRGMLALARKLGFVVGDSGEGPMVKRAVLALAGD